MWSLLLRLCLDEAARTEKTEKRRLRILRNVLLPMLSRYEDVDTVTMFFSQHAWPLIESRLLREQVFVSEDAIIHMQILYFYWSCFTYFFTRIIRTLLVLLEFC